MTFVSPLPRIPVHSDEAPEHDDLPENDTGLDAPVAFRVTRLRSQLLTADQLDDLPSPEPLIDGVLMLDSLAVLYGKPGSGKSFVALDWALCVSVGEWWADREVTKAPVLYIAAEGANGLKDRKQAWQEEHGVKSLADVHIFPGTLDLLEDDWSIAAGVVAEWIGAKLVIVDTLARSMVGGDENSARDMGRAIRGADDLRQATGACVVLVHHDTKSGETMRGSSALLGAVDTSIELKGDAEFMVLSCQKQKDGRPFDPIHLQRVEVGPSCVIRPHDGRGSNSEAERQLLDTIWQSCGSEGLGASALMKASGMPERTFYRALKALRSRGEIVNVGSEGRPRWTPVGETQSA